MLRAKMPRSGAVAAQNAQHVGEFLQVRERALDAFFLRAADEVEVEQVLPGTAAQGARLDFDDAQITQREGAQGAEERAGLVADGEDERGFPALFPMLVERQRGLVGAAQQEETGDVLA